jgi:hypothetical protein
MLDKQQLRKAASGTHLKFQREPLGLNASRVDVENIVDAILADIAAQGFVIVPTVATPEMVEAGWMARDPRESLEANSIATWTAMIPTSPAQGD